MSETRDALVHRNVLVSRATKHLNQVSFDFSCNVTLSEKVTLCGSTTVSQDALPAFWIFWFIYSLRNQTTLVIGVEFLQFAICHEPSTYFLCKKIFYELFLVLLGDSEHDGNLTESVSTVQKWEEYFPALQSAKKHDKGR